MADASCSGPSPFKRLIDHQSRDVSHHQDRLTDRSAAQGQSSFRSATPNSAQVQDNFNAFANGGSPLPGLPHDPAGRLAAHAAVLEPAHAHHFGAASQSRASPAPAVNNWASDFQRFSGSSHNHAPFPNTQTQTAYPAQARSQMNFAAAFGQPMTAFPPAAGPAFMNNAPMAQQPLAQSDFDQEMSRWMATHGGGSNGGEMKEVDAMFDQVAHELELYEAVLPQTQTEPQATTTAGAQDTETYTTRFTDLETPEIGNLSLESQQPESTVAKDTINEDVGRSAVSEAAERLLESVQHEDGEKWKNSVFLSLMRDFRDGKKDVIDNEVRQVGDGGGEDAKPNE